MKRSALHRPAASRWTASAGLALWLTTALAACSPSLQTSPLQFGDATGVYTAGNLRLVTERNRVQPATGHVLPTLCTEPSPDYALGFDRNASISAALAKLGNGSLDLASTEAVTPLEGRSAGVLALRDGLYAACQSYANGIIGHDAYALILSQYGAALVDLMDEPASQPPAAAAAEAKPDASSKKETGAAAPAAGKNGTNAAGKAALYDAVFMETAGARSPLRAAAGADAHGAVGAGTHAAPRPMKATTSSAAQIDVVKAQQAAFSAILVSCISEHDPTRIGGEKLRPKNPMLSVPYCQRFMTKAIASGTVRP